MAIFKFKGGNSGIKEYLEEGKKEGREQSREEIDQRIVLEGDLEICDRIINSRETDGERYDHITLSFKEKDMTPEMMKAIAAEFREFALQAYGPDELYFYAEAHMPKTATERKWNAEKREYEMVERFPHIHFVIPKTNLVTGGYTSPFELLRSQYATKDKTLDFTDAFQETINKKYGLASPHAPENRRTEFVGQSDMISRIKEDEFKGRNREALTMIRDKMIAEKIESPEAFREMLDKIGVVTVGHGRGGDYLQIKLPDYEQNIRLKDRQFKDDFLSYSMQEKYDYYSKKSAGQTPEQQAAAIANREVMLEKWQDIRAREIKYVRSRSKSNEFYQEHYVKATDDEKIIILDRLEVAHYAKLEQKFGYINTDPKHLAAIERLRQVDGLDQPQRDAVEQYAGTVRIEEFTSAKLNTTYLRTSEQLREAETAGKQIIKEPETAIASLTFSQSHFNEAALERHLLKHTADQDQYNKAMKAVLAYPELIVSREGERLLFTSKTIVAIEKSLSDRTERMTGERVGAVSAPEQQCIIDAKPFNAGQREAFTLLCSDKQLAVVNGAPGTGKSFVLASMREAYEAEGHKVYGAILQGKTAEDLERDSGIQSRTIAKMLIDLEKGKLKLDSKSVLVVDEAGMVGSRDLEKLMKYTEEAGARLRLVGDGKQLAAVEFGNAFVEVSKRAEVASLTQIMRQKTEWMREASEKFSVHDIGGLVDYAEKGHVHIKDTKKDAQIGLVKAWADHRAEQPEQTRIVLAHTNAARVELNDMMRAELKAQGKLQHETIVNTARGPLAMAVGEQVMFTKGDKDLGVKNGTTGIVAKINAQGVVTVLLENGKTAQFNASQGPEKGTQIDYGYAVTVHKSQGMTLDKSFVLADPSMTKENLGVAMTRHRHSAELFGSAEQFPTVADMVQTLDRAGTKAFTAEKTWDSAQRPEDSVIGQHVADLNAERVIRNAAKTADYKEVIANLEAKRVLDFVSKSHGIDTEKFQIVKNESGKELIQFADGKALDAAAFLTKTMHLDYRSEAAPILKQCYAEQLENAYSQPRREPGQAIDQTIQSEFAAHQVERTAQYKIEKEKLDEAKRTGAAAIEKTDAQEADKAGALAALAKKIKAEKVAIKAEYDQPTAVVYKEFLAEQAPDSERHRAELARVTFTTDDRDRLALVTAQAQGIECSTPDLSHLTRSQIEKGLQNVIDRSPKPPAHVLARGAGSLGRPADNLIRSEELPASLQAETRGSVHELPERGLDGENQIGGVLLPGVVPRDMGHEQTGFDSDVRRGGAGPDRGRGAGDAVASVARADAGTDVASVSTDASHDAGTGTVRRERPVRVRTVEAQPGERGGNSWNVTEPTVAADPHQVEQVEALVADPHQVEPEMVATEAQKLEDEAKAAEAERLSAPAQLADIHQQIAAVSSKRAVPAPDEWQQAEAEGPIVAVNETSIAVSTGRDEITIYPADQLAATNLDYDGIAEGRARFAVGNMVKVKQLHDGSTTVTVSEERQALQTEERKKRDRDRGR